MTDADFFARSEAWGEENRRRAVGACGDELQFTRVVSAMVDRDAMLKYTRSDGMGEGIRSGVSLREIADPKRRGSPPARAYDTRRGNV